MSNHHFKDMALPYYEPLGAVNMPSGVFGSVILATLFLLPKIKNQKHQKMEKKEMNVSVRDRGAKRRAETVVNLPMEMGAFMLRQVDEYFEKKGGVI